jgi:hypothetical protein
MKRFLASLSTISLIEVIGRHPAMAAGMLSLLGVGGGAVISGMLTPPTLLPQISSNFNPNQTIGTTNNGLKPNGGTAGAVEPPVGPSTGATGSFGLYFETQVDPAFGYANGGAYSPFADMLLLANASSGQPAFIFQRTTGGATGTQWWETPHVGGSAQVNAAAGSNYATGFYSFTATGGGCAREPSGVWQGGAGPVEIVDPGFGCSTAPTFNAATIPNAGAQQTGITATCASGGLGILVTTSVPVSPGLSPGLTYPVNFASSGGGTSLANATLTAVSVTGSGPYTVVGTIAGTCPGTIPTGTFGSGISAAFNFPTLSTTNPFSLGGTGITTKNGQKICGIIGEYGDDSPFPGAQFLSMVDAVTGAALPGSPALVQTPNMGTANFTGWTTIGSSTLNVSGMNAYPIVSAAWSSTVSGFPGLGLVTFQMGSSNNPGYIAGSEFTVSGMLPSSVNGAYIAVNGTTSTQVIGNQLTAIGGVPQAFASPGTITTATSPQMISAIFPGMQILGSTPAASFVLPYGSAGSTGTGSNGSIGTPATYALSASQTATLGGGASPGSTIFAWQASYWTAATGGAGPGGSTLTVRPQYLIGDFTGLIGSSSPVVSGAIKSSWGGTLGNFSMVYTPGGFPTQTGSAPSTAALASICTKTTDVQTYALANGFKTQSLYRLNDLGIWGDSGNATIKGYISAATGTSGGTATLNVVGSPTFGSLALATGTETAKLTGLGLPVASSTITTTTAATIPLTTTASSTYTVTFPAGVTSVNVGSIGSPVTLAVGAFLPALPIQSNTMQGYIDTTAGVSTLHVTSLDDGTAHSGFASFTGTLGTSFTARIDAGGTANAAAGNTLTVTLPTGTPPNNAYIGVGTVVCPAVGTSTFTCATVTALGTGVGYQGTYTLNGSAQNITGQVMFGSGVLPGPATTLQTTSITEGTIGTGMAVTDGGVSLTGSPLLITAGSGAVWTVAGNYYPPIAADATMTASLTTLVPGEYIQNSLITNPVKIASYGSGAIGLTGNYVLSGSPNASNAVGSSGLPVVFTGTTITDGGAIAPGPALTIRDQGPGVIFPVNHSTGTGALALSGAYATGTLGGTPSAIQALVSLSANGPALAGCTPCNWGALTGTVSAGAWSGTIAGIPGGGPYYVSVRAANGTAYATLPNSVRIGDVYALWGQGQAGSINQVQSGSYVSWFSDLWGYIAPVGAFSGNEAFLLGPPVTGAFVPGQTVNHAGDRFGITGTGIPLSEGTAAFDQELSNIYASSSNGYSNPISMLYPARDGVGIGDNTLGNSTQTQTIGSGTGSAVTWCSATKFCNNVDVGQPLLFNAASLTGGWFSGSIATSAGVSTLTATTRQGGALEPGMVLSDGGVNIPGSPTLLRCVTGCTGISSLFPLNFSGSTWILSANLGTVGAENMRADPNVVGGAPWPNFNIQAAGAAVYGFVGYGTPLVKAGTFQITDTNPATGVVTTLCQDSQVFAYNNTGGNCTPIVGASPAISSAWVNYQTGDYGVTFSTAPTSGHAITASWTNIISPEPIVSASLSRPQGFDYFGDGTCQSGPVSSQFCKVPGGVSGHIYSGYGTDKGYFMNNLGPSQNGYQFGGIGYSQMVSWLFDTRFPNVIPGASQNVQFLTTGQWRIEGPVAFSQQSDFFDGITEQDAQDMATKSTFSGTVSIALNATVGTVTLSGPATGPMWEGQIIGCVTYSLTNCPVGPLSGVYLTGLASGAWGASGSVYNLASAAGPAVAMGTAEPMQNAVDYSGPGPVLYAGTLNDIIVQNSGFSGTTGRNPHPSNGFTGGRRATSRWAAMIWSASAANPNQTTDPNLAADPKNDRVAADAGGCDLAALAAPCFDIGSGPGTHYPATSSSVGWTTAGLFTVTGGLAAHARPFVVGQAVSCSPACGSGLVITSLSVSPTESTATGAGEVGQTFTFQTAAPSGGALPSSNVSSGGTATASCFGTSGSGSSCIDIAFSLNVGGTFGTAAALDTCGANNLNGNAPNYVVPNGKCQGNGIGEIVRAFRIGTQQVMSGTGLVLPIAGSVLDDGVDFSNGQFVQSSAFTCNIVAAKVVQCVKGPLYSAGLFTSVGEWSSAIAGAPQTFISYGDETIVSGRIASLLGYVGGQSFPFTAGSGMSPNSTITETATCTTMASGGTAPRFDVTVAGGSIVNVVPSAQTTGNAPVGLGVGSTCTVPITGFSGGTLGSINTIPLAPVEGFGGIGTYNTDSNTMGMFLYDNSGEPGNPLYSFFTNGQGGYFEPGLPVRPFGLFQGAVVSG